jgi:hypothetical protein
MVRSWSGLNATNGYIFLSSTMDFVQDMDDDGNLVFFLFSGTCYVARVGLP